MAKPEARQYTFLTLVPVLSQEGTEPAKKHRYGKNPDQQAVFDFLQ